MAKGCSWNHSHPCNQPGYKGPPCGAASLATVAGRTGTLVTAHLCCGYASVAASPTPDAGKRE